MKKHFLELAHEELNSQGLGHLWTPGSTAWRDKSDVSDSTVARAIRMGYLGGSGIPQLTRDGYRKF